MVVRRTNYIAPQVMYWELQSYSTDRYPLTADRGLACGDFLDIPIGTYAAGC